MSDSPSGSEVVEEMSADEAASIMYGEPPTDDESEQLEPSDLDNVEEVSETGEDEVADVEAGATDSDDSKSGDVDDVVFDEPNDFVKYEYDEDKGLFEFKSEGKTVKANIEKLISSFNQERNYTKDKMEFAEEKKAFTEQARAEASKEFSGEQAKVAAIYGELKALHEKTEKEIDWDDLRQYDMPEYTRLKEEQTALKEALTKTQDDFIERQGEARKATEDREMKLLVDSMPEWQDKEVQSKDFELMTKGFNSLGFSDEERAQMLDHRAYKAAMYAQKYLDLVASSSKVKPKALSSKSLKTKRAPSSDKELTPEQIFYGS